MAVDTIAGLKAKMPANTPGGTTISDIYDLIDTVEDPHQAIGQPDECLMQAETSARGPELLSLGGTDCGDEIGEGDTAL